MRKFALLFFLMSLIWFGFEANFGASPYPFRKLTFFPKMPESLENPVTKEGALLGRYLFYDPVLSYDSSISCASCHKQEFAFSDSPHTLSKGKEGISMKRNTLPLFNLAWYSSLFWDGRAGSIEAQIFHPLQAKEEMDINWKKTLKKLAKNKFYSNLFQKAFPNQKIDSVKVSFALAQFLRTLISNQSKYDEVITNKNKFTKTELEGFVLVNDQTKGDCLHCHTTDGNALGTTIGFSNNGLDSMPNPNNFADKGFGAISKNLKDNGKFKIPSLRNIALTNPYMHDGRFKTLEEVLDFYSQGLKQSATLDPKMEFVHQGGAHLTGEEKHSIIAFLKTLTDNVFILNPEYSNPFKK